LVDIYFIGDGAGKAGNIVTAAATGVIAAHDILKSIKIYLKPLNLLKYSLLSYAVRQELNLLLHSLSKLVLQNLFFR